MIDISDTKELVFALAGNPNVGKSTVFNQLTGLKQHTGNWSGKTVTLATGEFEYKDYKVKIVDLPGSYSVFPDSPEEKITSDYIKSGEYNCLVIVADATTLERNLNLTLQILGLTDKVVLCLNFMDEIKKKGIEIDTDELSLQLGIPVVSVTARHNKGISKLIDTALKISDDTIKTYRNYDIARVFEEKQSDIQISEKIDILSKRISNACVGNKGQVYGSFDKRLDRILLSPVSGIAAMILMFSFVFWLTAYGANYPGEILTYLFGLIRLGLEDLLNLMNSPSVINSVIIDGVYTTVSWVVSVMLPPALIFFPLFALLEDSGILPRFAFNLDRCFSKVGTNGKQALTMLMGFGCNVCGVMGCRIIRSRKERLCAIVTNSFIPCNGRLPTLIALASIFFCGADSVYGSFKVALILLLLLVLAVLITLVVSFLFTRLFHSEEGGCFILELPPYRKPQFIKTILSCLKDKVLYVLSRAVMVSVPAGLIIWLLSNVQVNDITLMNYLVEALGVIGAVIGLDGVILVALLLCFPANEIFIPILIMAYSSNSILMDYSSTEALGSMLVNNGWTQLTAIMVMILCLFHFPCFTTCVSIKKETGSVFWTVISVIVPMITGFIICLIVNLLVKLLS